MKLSTQFGDNEETGAEHEETEIGAWEMAERRLLGRNWRHMCLQWCRSK